MMKATEIPILIHIGPHKTGTTWLQKKLLMSANGVVYDSDTVRSHRAFIHPRFENFSPRYAKEIFAPLLDKARQEKKALIISDEALGGRPFGQRFFREIIADRIYRTFPDAKVLITIREQNSIIMSIFSEYLRYGYSSSLESFLCQETRNPHLQPLLDLEYYEWDSFRTVYSSFFPMEQILAIPMEWGLENGRNYSDAIESFIGSSLGFSKNVDISSVERKSLSGWALSVLRTANKLQPQDSRYLAANSKLSPNSLSHYVDRITPNIAREQSRRKMRRTIDEYIGDRFAKSNRIFQDSTGFSLEALNYKVSKI